MTLPNLLEHIAAAEPDAPAQFSKDAQGVFAPRSFRELLAEVDRFAAGLLGLGVTRGDRVGLIAENRAEWLVCDLGVLSVGAIDVPRGNDATIDELRFILSTSATGVCVVENQTQLAKVAEVASAVPGLTSIIVMDSTFQKPSGTKVKVLAYAEVVERGKTALAENPTLVSDIRDQGHEDDTATIIFTSGTTGEPKGVVLTHANFMYQVRNVPGRIEVGQGDIWLAVLPVWHSFERIMQYVALGTASALAYSKPVGQIMLADLQAIKPTWMASVPRIWEAVRAGVLKNVKKGSAVTRALFAFFIAVGGTHAHLNNLLRGRLPRFGRRSRLLDAMVALLPWLLLWPAKALGDALVFGKIRARLGGNFRAGISGGGALPGAVDRFFSAAGILLLEGYGLTETAPVICVREQRHPVPGTVGPGLGDNTEIKIVAEDGATLKPGKQGTVHVRGPQVMVGYYNRQDLTDAVIDSDGWLDTGDLGVLTHDGELAITGRAKDTIVLLGGENVEPAPIEERIRESEFIAQAMVVGQDQKYLSALLVPDFEALNTWAEAAGVQARDRALVGDPATRDHIRAEIDALVNSQAGFKLFEKIGRFAILDQAFEIGAELSAKQEIKRHVIADKYAQQIQELYR